jgi:serine protease Do
MGLSFAIPIEVARDVADQLRRDGRVTRGRLGVSIQELTEDLAKAFRLGDVRGALITQVEPDGPAQRAGIEAGDVILRFDGQDVSDAAELPRLVAGARPGSEVTIDLWRAGAARSVTAKVGRAPTEELPAVRLVPSRALTPSAAGRIGARVSELPPQARSALGLPYGLVVDDVQNAAGSIALHTGDVIVAINGQPFSSLDQFNDRIGRLPAGAPAALLVRRGDTVLFVPLKVAG